MEWKRSSICRSSEEGCAKHSCRASTRDRLRFFDSLSGERVGFALHRTRVLRQQISHLLPSASAKKTA